MAEKVVWLQPFLGLFRRFALHDAVYDEGDGSVAGHVAGGAEAVHGDVEGYHQGLVGLREAQHGA